MIRRLLDELPDEPTATEATAIAVQLARIEGYLSRDMGPTTERAVADAQEPLIARIAVLEETVKSLVTTLEAVAAETAKRNLALETICTAIRAEEENPAPRPVEKSVLKKLVNWVEEGDR